MKKPKAVGLGAVAMDDESRAIIYEGVSKGQLMKIFGLDRRVIDQKLYGLEPCGERMGYPVYKLSEAASRLAPPSKEQIEYAIKKMGPKELPPELTGEYWKAQHARLKFEEDTGDLWRTADVIELFSEVAKTIRMSLLLMRDRVERNTTVTDRQRDIIQSLIDTTLNEMADKLDERFKNEPKRKSDGRDEPEASSTDAEDEPL